MENKFFFPYMQGTFIVKICVLCFQVIDAINKQLVKNNLQFGLNIYLSLHIKSKIVEMVIQKCQSSG